MLGIERVFCMQLTVNEALGIYPLSEAKLVAGAQGGARIIKSVNVMDAPDIAEWIKSGELLFTTAFVMKDSEDEAVMLLRKLHERGCAGLGIKLGRFWEHIPNQIVEEANHLGLPLIELPFQFTFSDQMNALFKAEYERNTKTLQTVVEKQKKLMQFALNQDHKKDVFAKLVSIIGHPIAVIGSRGHLLFASEETKDLNVQQGWPYKPMFQRVKWDHGSCYRVPITQKDEDFGFLLIYTDGAYALKEEEELFQQAAEVLAYDMDMTYREHINPTLQDEMCLVMKQYLERKINGDELVRRSEGYGIQLFQGNYQCVLTTVEPEIFADGKLLKQIHRELQYNPMMQLTNSSHIKIDGGILSIYTCPAGKDYGEELSRFLLSRFEDMIEPGKTAGGSMPRFWISKMKYEPKSLREAYQECLDTRALAARFGMKEVALQFETLEFAYLFSHVPESVMENYCNKVLEPLQMEGGDPSQILMNTLEVFIENDGLINEAAKQLFVHRNTITYRMDKISTLLQMDLKKSNDLLKLKLVFTFRNYLQAHESNQSIPKPHFAK